MHSIDGVTSRRAASKCQELQKVRRPSWPQHAEGVASTSRKIWLGLVGGVQLSGFGVKSVSPWKLSTSGSVITASSVGKNIGYVGRRFGGGWLGGIDVVLRWMSIGSLSISDSDSRLASGCRGYCREAMVCHC
jgi:hypothetical protein